MAVQAVTETLKAPTEAAKADRQLLHTEFAALLARAGVSQAAFARLSGYTPRQGLGAILGPSPGQEPAGNAAHNVAVLRHTALNAVQKDASKGSFRGKLKRAGWDDACLSRLLALF